MNIKNQIIDLIDDINVTEADVRYDTMCKMYESYDKASMILEYYDGDNIDAFNIFNDTDNFYQESSISDKMKDSGKKYGTLMKILTFIPRLIKALFQTISEKLKKTKPAKELQNASKETKKALADAFDKKKDKKKRVGIISALLITGGVAVATGTIHLAAHKQLVNFTYKAERKSLDNIRNNPILTKESMAKINPIGNEIEKNLNIIGSDDKKYTRKDKRNALKNNEKLFEEIAAICNKDPNLKNNRKNGDIKSDPVVDAKVASNNAKVADVGMEVVEKQEEVKSNPNLGHEEKKEKLKQDLADAEKQKAELEKDFKENMQKLKEQGVSDNILNAAGNMYKNSMNMVEKLFNYDDIVKNVNGDNHDVVSEQGQSSIDKKAEKIVDDIDRKLDEINKKYKVLVNKLYSHDSMPLPPDEKQSVGVKLTDKEDDIEYFYDSSSVGGIARDLVCKSLDAYDSLVLCISNIKTDDEGKLINDLDEIVNKVRKDFNTDKNKTYSFRKNGQRFLTKSNTDKKADLIEEFINDIHIDIEKFNKRSDKDKELIMTTPSVQEAIKYLNSETKFYRDVFYDVLSLYVEMTKLIDNTCHNLKVKASDGYKFDKSVERLSNINFPKNVSSS